MTKRWYIVQVHSGFESKVKDSILEQAELKGLQDDFENILVPTEEVIELRRGKKVTNHRKFFPGYILIKMRMSSETQHLVKSENRVAGFLGGDHKPSPISEKEAMRIITQIEEGVDRPRPAISFEVGETIRVCDGPFASFNGYVELVDEEKQRLRVAVSIFGRETPVDLEYTQVEKQ